MIVVLRSVTYYAVTTLLVVHLSTHRGLSLALATAALTVFTATGAAVTLLGGYLTRRAPRTAVIAASYLLTTPAIIGPATVTGAATTLACAALLGLGLHIPVALHTTLGQHLLPRHVGTAAGVTPGLSVSVNGLAAPLAGAAAQHVGTTTTLLAVAALPLAAAAATLTLVHPHTRPPSHRPPRDPARCPGPAPAARHTHRRAHHPRSHAGPRRGHRAPRRRRALPRRPPHPRTGQC